MKSYTDLEQSKKLAEILPIDSADMCYPLPYEEGDKPLLEQGGFGSTPCWSLAALLDILPETIEDEWAEYELKIDMIDKKPKYVNSDFPSWDWNNKELLDNIVEAIIWLYNNNYL